MCHQHTTTTATNDHQAILTFSLSKDKAEIVLIALNALYELHKNENIESQQIIDNGMKYFGIDTLPDDFENQIGILCDEVYDPYENFKYPMIAKESLMQINIDDLTNTEIQHIVQYIEGQKSKINQEAL